VQVSLTRGQIRTQVQNLMGLTSGANLAVALAQMNSQIDRAYYRVLADCPWVSQRRITRTDLGVDAIWLNYPSGCSEGGVVRIAYWDADAQKHIMLERRDITPEMDYEPLNAAGGDDDEAKRGDPQYWTEMDGQIRIHPPNEEVRELYIEHTVQTPLSADSVTPVVDAELIIIDSHRRMLEEDELYESAQRQEGYYQERLRNLRGKQHHGQAIVHDPGSVIDGRSIADGFAHIPNWDRRPTVR
jgi:acetyl esterase/lipase